MIKLPLFFKKQKNIVDIELSSRQTRKLAENLTTRTVTDRLSIGKQPETLKEIQALKNQGITTIYSFDNGDYCNLKPKQEKQMCSQLGINFINSPCVPTFWPDLDFPEDYTIASDRLIETLSKPNEKVFAHCCYGSERSGPIADRVVEVINPPLEERFPQLRELQIKYDERNTNGRGWA